MSSISTVSPEARTRKPGISIRSGMLISGSVLVLSLLAGMALMYKITDSARIGSDN